jgi:hypothetical protein
VLLRVGGYFKIRSLEIMFTPQHDLSWMNGEQLKPSDLRRERTTKAFPQIRMERTRQMRHWLEEAGMELEKMRNWDVAMYS